MRTELRKQLTHESYPNPLESPNRDRQKPQQVRARGSESSSQPYLDSLIIDLLLSLQSVVQVASECFNLQSSTVQVSKMHSNERVKQTNQSSTDVLRVLTNQRAANSSIEWWWWWLEAKSKS